MKVGCVVVIIGVLAFSSRAALGGEPDAPKAAPQRLSLGLNYLGLQLRCHIKPDWAAEARALTGSSSSNEGSIQGFSLGLRGYRFFTSRNAFKPYLGLEAAYARASIQGSNTSGIYIRGFGDSAGLAAGGFAGVEYRLSHRLALDLDMGPHIIRLKEKVTGVSSVSWDFVANVAVNWYLY